ncbi:hypothetical protein CYCD_08980 [Tenuifilaceae bacterium CYCD]|nr:hypothetical protein CYCD_08980 [Tenuifilaceae bacterium CYCD]
MKLIRYFLKFLALIIALLIVTIVSTGIYIAFNQKKIAENFLSIVEKDVKLDINYSDFNINLFSHFPFVALTFDNLSINLPKSELSTNILSARSLSLTVNSINLIQGKFNLRNCIVESGTANYYPKIVDSLINEYSCQERNTNNPQNISINKFRLNNYDINIYDIKNKLSTKLSIDKSLISIDFKNNKLITSIKSSYKKIEAGEFEFEHPFKIDLYISKTDNICNINGLEINCNNIKILASGGYNIENGKILLRFSSNNFATNNLIELLPVKTNNFRVEGRSNVSGSVDYNINTGILHELTINHKTKGILSLNNHKVKINDLSVKTQLFDNFSSHNSTISKADIEFNEMSAIFSARVKGINNPIVLAEGLIKLNNSKFNIANISGAINSLGNIKVLGRINTSNDDFRLTYQNIKGSADFSIGNLMGIDRINDISGKITFDKNVSIVSSGKFDNMPFSITINQDNIINLLNDNYNLNPEIKIKAESINVDYFTEYIAKLPESKDSSKVNDTYTITVDSKNLQFMDYNFKSVNCKMQYSDNIFEIKNFSGNGFDGMLSGSMKNIDNKYFISTDFNGMSISKLFNHYDNFKQSYITGNNLSGNLSGSVILNFITDNGGQIVMPSIKMETDVTISDGKLMGMNKIDKLSKWLKLDQVKSIDFKTLHNRIEISDQCVRIPRMDVFSNVINMELSGEHYFAGNYTYWMKINFSQVLSRRFLNSSSIDDTENTSNGAINLYLKLIGDSNDYNVSLDKKSSFEKIKGNLNTEGNTIKEMLKDEYKTIVKKDTSKNPEKDSSLQNKTKFNIEWDEYDTLNVDNN